ncbi:MAG TPA: hypothetical protein VFP71_11435 [Candidatus Angelobacter sp.]|nr:hypothetical protein [Candidatus Angelobacter sp.]
MKTATRVLIFTVVLSAMSFAHSSSAGPGIPVPLPQQPSTAA